MGDIGGIAVGLIDVVFRKARRAVRAVREHLVPPPVPEELIAGRLDGMSSTIARCKGQLTPLMNEQRELQAKVSRNANQITLHLREARLCAARGEEELAAEHLRARCRHEQLAVTLERQLADFRRQIERLVDHVRGLELTVEDTRRRNHLLVAQRECIQAHLLLNGTPSGTGTMGDLLEGLEEEVVTMQAVAQLTAGQGMPTAAEVSLNDELMRRRVDDELGQLRRQLAPPVRECALVPALDDDVLYITG